MSGYEAPLMPDAGYSDYQDDEAEYNAGEDRDAVVNLLASALSAQANLARPQSKAASSATTGQGELSIGEVVGHKNVKSSVVKALTTPENADFMTVVENTPAAAELERAAAQGASITIFAPSNAAMAAMPNNMSNNLRLKSKAAQRHQFVNQHIMLNREERTAEARYEANDDEQPVALASMNGAMHIALHPDPSRPEAGMEAVARMHNSDGEFRASAKLTGGGKFFRQHKAFTMQSALLPDTQGSADSN
jgi:uncharacterized surface protein with fasciclin (FAS1) repeats